MLDRRGRGEGKPETFDFLGFTHICERTRKGNRFTVRRKMVTKRLRAKLQAVKEHVRRHLHHDGALAHWLRSVVQGFMNFHAIPGNLHSVLSFRKHVIRYWYHALRRRGDRHRITWPRFGPSANRWLSGARVMHPYPSRRFAAIHPR